MMSWEMLGAAATLISLLNGLFFWAVKWLLDRHYEQLERRFTAIELANKEREDLIATLERNVLELRAELPEKYVQRQDWIRFSAVIDAKLDAVREVLSTLKERVHERGT